MFDEQPDGDPHGECAAEIHRLEHCVRELRVALARCEAYLAPRVTGTGGFGEQTLLPAVHEALRAYGGEAGEMEAAKGEATPLPTHPQQEKL